MKKNMQLRTSSDHICLCQESSSTSRKMDLCPHRGTSLRKKEKKGGAGKLIALGKLQSHPSSMVSWSWPPQPFNKFTHTPILTSPTCASHNTSLNPVLNPPNCASHKISTAERVKPIINHPMASQLHYIEGKTKQLTQLMIPTGHTLLHPAGKLLASYSDKGCSVYFTSSLTVPHTIASLNWCPHV